MTDSAIEKPSHEEWLHWAQVAIERLTTIVHVYSKPPHEDIFMPEKDRQEKNGKALTLLRGIHGLTDDVHTPTESLAEVAYHDERVIAGLAVLLRDLLHNLPEFSTDMQKFLKSPWHSKCTGRTADELFRGQADNESEGIGSGHPEHGRFPEVLRNLLEQEQIGDIRRPREALQREGEPRRHDETQRRWTDKNSQFLRSAGRVE